MGIVSETKDDYMPVSMDLANAYLRESGVQQAAVTELDILASEEHHCGILNQYITKRTIIEKFDTFPCGRTPLVLGRPPLISVTSVAYLDADGASQSLVENTDFIVDIGSRPGRIYPVYGESWPSTRCIENAVTVTYVCGFATAAVIRPSLKLLIAQYAADVFKNREAAITGTIIAPNLAYEALVAQERDWGAF